MTTKVQKASTSAREVLVSKNATIIVDELRKKLFEKLPALNNLTEEVSRLDGLMLIFENRWLDRHFSPTEVRNDSMDAADKEFERWFVQSFGIEVRVMHMYLGAAADPYDGTFGWIIYAVKKRRNPFRGLWSRKR